MNILITAGNTLTLIDSVRCITNIFTGRTGARIALAAHARGHAVTLLTSHPDAIHHLAESPEVGPRWLVWPYRTFDDLHARMAELISAGSFDAIVHCAAVSDYLSAGVYSPDQGTSTCFDRDQQTWTGSPPTMIDRTAGKVKSDAPELWIRLVRAPKLVDLIRPAWGFAGVLVKFKLEVGLSDAELLAVAERSRAYSDADLMVANTLAGASEYAFLGSAQGSYVRISRPALAESLLVAIESLVARRTSHNSGAQP